ncbi:MAG TPA: DUF4251 domain-containing protein [Chitinophagaceae bacterium]
MKAINYFIVVLALIITATSCAGPGQARNSDIAGLIESKRFVFVAQTANPLGMRSRQLTGEYDLRITPDSIISFLPYFGRAYAAPIDSREGGIRFTSTKFEYVQSVGRRGGWNINIRPADAQDVRELNLNISSGGIATLQVNSNNRQSISFSGQIVARR